MSKRPSSSGLKRQVSPVVAIVIIVLVIGIVLLAGFWKTLFKDWGAERTSSKDMGSEQEIQSLADVRRVSQERLGVSLRPGSGFVTVIGGVPGVTTELQPEDKITAINGVKITKSLMTVAAVSNKVPVGQPLTLTVQRGSQTLDLKVQRRESTAAPAGGTGRMPGPGMMGRGR